MPLVHQRAADGRLRRYILPGDERAGGLASRVHLGVPAPVQDLLGPVCGLHPGEPDPSRGAVRAPVARVYFQRWERHHGGPERREVSHLLVYVERLHPVQPERHRGPAVNRRRRGGRWRVLRRGGRRRRGGTDDSHLRGSRPCRPQRDDLRRRRGGGQSGLHGISTRVELRHTRLKVLGPVRRERGRHPVCWHVGRVDRRIRGFLLRVLSLSRVLGLLWRRGHYRNFGRRGWRVHWQRDGFHVLQGRQWGAWYHPVRKLDWHVLWRAEPGGGRRRGRGYRPSGMPCGGWRGGRR